MSNVDGCVLGGEVGRIDAVDCEAVVKKICQACSTPANAVDRTALYGISGQALYQHLRCRVDNGQRGANFVREHRDKLLLLGRCLLGQTLGAVDFGQPEKAGDQHQRKHTDDLLDGAVVDLGGGVDGDVLVNDVLSLHGGDAGNTFVERVAQLGLVLDHPHAQQVGVTRYLASDLEVEPALAFDGVGRHDE